MKTGWGKGKLCISSGKNHLKNHSYLRGLQERPVCFYLPFHAIQWNVKKLNWNEIGMTKELRGGEDVWSLLNEGVKRFV